MFSPFDDLFRREREQMEFLRRQAEQALAPFRQHQQFLDGIVAPSLRASLGLRTNLEAQLGGLFPERPATASLLAQAELLTTKLAGRDPILADLAVARTPRIADEIKGLLAPTLTKRIQDFIEPTAMKTLRDFLPRLGATDYLAKMTADMAAVTRSSTNSISRLIADAMTPLAVRDSIAGLLAQFENLAAPQAMVTPEGFLIDDDLVTAADLDAQIADALADAEGAPREERFQAFLAQCAAILRKAPKPIAQALFAMLCAVLYMIAEGEVQSVSTEVLAPTRKAILAKVRELTGIGPAPQSTRRYFRLVTAKGTLNVRLYPRVSDSRIVGAVPFGKVVVMVREGKDWTLVQYLDGETVIQGWVYTRYLQKIAVPSEN